MIQYGSSAKSISELNFVKLKVAESWIEGHKRAYPVFHTWAANIGRLGETRGWASSQLGSLRFVNESNAKGQEEGAMGRLSVSHTIQSSASNQAKLALILTSQAIKNTKAKLVSFIHDFN